jgi:DNA-binding SARP family transcriptional activator/Tfp pilus assembly protein PilF
MDFALLGPLTVRQGESAVSISAGKLRVLLATLLLAGNKALSIDELIDKMWDGNEPPAARITLQGHVKRLRRSLGDPDGSRVATEPPGYAIRTATDELDVTRFHALHARGRRAAAEHRWADAVDQLSQALSLWRGEPLLDVPSATLAREALPRLAEARLQALGWRIEADLRLGRHAEVIGELQELALAYPMWERFHGQLMLALYRSGRQADALAAYQTLRGTLAEELGADPTQDLQRLRDQILAADPALHSSDAAVAAGSAPRGDPIVLPRQLPAGVTRFTGRSEELTILTELLDGLDEPGGAVVVAAISGTAGVGKTVLAVRWAHHVAHRFPDGQLYVNLRGFDPSGTPMTPAEAIRGFLDAFGVPPDRIPFGVDAQAGLYRSVLADRKILVLLDNARDAEQVRPLLPGGTGCLVLVTSRNRLPNLDVGARLLHLDLPSAVDARELLAQHLGARRVAAEPEAVAELIDRCARLPLALRAVAAVAAASHPAMPLADLVSQLRDLGRRLDALEGGGPTDSVRTALCWSYRQLSEPAARMFRLLANHPGPDITLPAAASLAATTVAQVRAALVELVTGNLLTEHAPSRFGWHDLMRAYAVECAQDDAEDNQLARRRLLDHYLHTAAPASLLINRARDMLSPQPAAPGVRPEQVTSREAAFAWYEAEHAVLLGLVSQAADHGFEGHAWRLAWNILDFLNMRGHWQDWMSTQRIALAAAERIGARDGQAHAHQTLGRAHTLQREHARASAHLYRAVELFESLGDLTSLARTHRCLSDLFEQQDRYEDALEHAERALALHRRTGEAKGIASALNSVGWYHAKLGNYQQSLENCTQALPLHREVGNPGGESATLDSLGYVYHRLGDHPRALASYRQALALRRKIGRRYYEGATLDRIGDIQAAMGDTEAAHESWQGALDVFTELHHHNADILAAKLLSRGNVA